MVCFQRKLSRMNYMIAHLTFADIFVACFNILPQLIWDITEKFYGNDVICKSVTYLQVVAMHASSYVIVATGMDRYRAICRPFHSVKWSTKSSNRLVAIAWGLSILFSIPQMFIFGFRANDGGEISCWAVFHPPWTVRIYVLWTAISIYAIPVLILFIIYSRICRTVWLSICDKSDIKVDMAKSRRKKVSMTSYVSSFRTHTTNFQRNLIEQPQSGSNTMKKRMSRAKMRTIKLTVIINASFILCWCPFFVSHVWAAFDHKAPYEGPAMTIILLLASLNSCVNPFIFIYF
uniref:G-protein coupled receptors family 1 profile domain-containing protein n=1 Tax=Helobdella robusta TaxID=6412 RepID=T1EHY9_HELRO